jgi:hypothetical protein
MGIKLILIILAASLLVAILDWVRRRQRRVVVPNLAIKATIAALIDSPKPKVVAEPAVVPIARAVTRQPSSQFTEPSLAFAEFLPLPKPRPVSPQNAGPLQASLLFWK